MLRPALFALAVVAALLLVPSAQAKTVKGKSITTQGDRINCFAVMPIAGGGIECHSVYIPEIGELDSYFGLKRRGRAHLSERGDYPGFNVRPKRVFPGDRWVWKGVRCRIGKRSVTCRNRSGHGFRIAPNGTRRF
jgi:hypothetical protein